MGININKRCPKTLLMRRFVIKITYFVFVLCLLLSVRFWSHLEAVWASVKFTSTRENVCSSGPKKRQNYAL